MSLRSHQWLIVTVTASLLLLASPAAAADDDDLVSPTIVGGQEATPGAYPFMAAIVDSANSDAYLGQFCGGSLIHPNWVMTAAHCTEGETPATIDVVLGRHDLRSNAGERIGAASITMHPDYNPVTFENDIALIELESASNQGVVGLANVTNQSLWGPGTMATVMGWGSTESVPLFPEVLYEVDVPIISDADCQASAIGNDLFASVMICAGDVAQGGVDSCDGDSGGPMVVPNGVGGWIEVGIVSWGFGCADPNRPGVYAQVSAFDTFIDDTIGEEPPPPPPGNTAPVANPDSYTVAAGGTLIAGQGAGVLSNDTDTDGDPLTAVLVSGPATGTLTLTSAGNLRYIHGGGPEASVTFTYVANDGTADSNVATVTITIDGNTGGGGEDYDFLVSTEPDRSNAVPFDGTTVSGKIYAFITPDLDVTDSTFFLDGAQIGRDRRAPFDMAGTNADGTARSYNTSRIAGVHAFSVNITLVDGSIVTLEATVTVQ